MRAWTDDELRRTGGARSVRSPPGSPRAMSYTPRVRIRSLTAAATATMSDTA